MFPLDHLSKYYLIYLKISDTCTILGLIFEIQCHKTASVGDVIVNVLASSAVDRGFDPRSGQIKDYEIGICCFSCKYDSLKRKSKDWLARNQDNVSELGDMSIRGLLFL
jgi:hypothetical protein